MESFPQVPFPKIFYLHHNWQTFWELAIDPMTNNLTERYGNLFSNGQEDTVNAQKRVTFSKSWQEALALGQRLVDQKTLEGFQTIEGNRPQLNIPMTQSVFVNNDVSPSQSNSLMNQNRLNTNNNRLKRKPGEPLVRDDHKLAKRMDSFSSEADRYSESSYSNVPEPSVGIGKKIVNFFKRIVASDNQEKDEYDDADHGEKEFTMSWQLVRRGSIVKEKAHDLGLKSEIYENVIKVNGDYKRIEDFKDYLEDCEKEIEDQTTKEISLSPFLMGMMTVIIKRAEELGVHLDIFDQKLLIEGSHKAIGDFLTYLVDLEATPIKEQYERKNLESIAQHEAALKLNSNIRESLNSMQKAITDLHSKVENSPSNANGNNGGQNERLDFRRENPEGMNISFMRSNSGKLIDKGLKLFNDSKDVVNEYVGNFIKKASVLYPNQNEDVVEMAKRIESLEKKLENQGSNTMNVEFEKKFSELLNFMEDKIKNKTSTSIVNTSQNRSQMKIEERDEFIRKEIGRSTYLRPRLEEIKKKAEELRVVIESITYEFFCVLGNQRDIDKFIVYLHELETKTKKALHPQYWNFMDSRQFSMITVPQNEKEFKDVTRLFTSYLPEFEIISLERIQNNYLMERYINQIQTLQELKPNEELSRRQLFFGTGTLNPYFIYKSFDAGFDVRFADNMKSGGYGQGLRFEINPIICHKRSPYRTPNGNYQLIIADVMLGKTKMTAPANFTKAPEGFHSVSENGEFFVVYNNFQSYPLYLIEYRSGSEFPQDSYHYSDGYE